LQAIQAVRHLHSNALAGGLNGIAKGPIFGPNSRGGWPDKSEGRTMKNREVRASGLHRLVAA